MVSFLRFPLGAIARKSSFDVDVLLLSLVPSPVLNVPLGSSTLFSTVLALWSGIPKNPDVNTGPLARPFAHSLAPPCLLR